jgi:hypothetical protein
VNWLAAAQVHVEKGGLILGIPKQNGRIMEARKIWPRPAILGGPNCRVPYDSVFHDN